MRITLRSDSVEIEGYVNAVGRDSRRLTDEFGYPFNEQIQPGTFANAIRAKQESDTEIQLKLDHERVIGGTGTNLELEEDSIGLHARATVTDPEVIAKARQRKLVGWSFGFVRQDYREEYSSDCRRVIITDMDLREVTIVDDNAIPAYAGTSIHTRTDGTSEQVLTRTMDNDAIYTVMDEPEPQEETRTEEPAPEPVDYSKYEETIRSLRN